MKTKFYVLTVVIVGVLFFSSCAPVPLFSEIAKLVSSEPTSSPTPSPLSPTLSDPTPTKVLMEKNIARAKPVTTSHSLNSNPASMAFDNTFNTWWGSGDFAPQWIEIDLRGYYTITKIKLTTSQDPSGDTLHKIFGRGADGKYHVLHTFEQFTQDGMQLQVIPEDPWQNISSIRIETLASPSWVSWREIMIFSREEPKALNDIPLTTPVPEGSKGVIAFYNNQVMGGIYLLPADGNGDPVLLSAHPTGDSKPSWSPDGTRIAFESLRDDPLERKRMDIYIMHSDGSHLTRLTGNDGVYSEPDWSPDGTQIVISGYQIGDTNSDLFLLDPETGKLTRLTTTSYIEADPTWSPDGTQIAYTSNKQGDNVWNLYILDVKTGEERQFTQGGGSDYQPDWSPRGDRILFVSTRNGDHEIYVMDVEGGDPTQLTDSPGKDNDPEWSPDGSSFVYSHGDAKFGELYKMDADGSNRTLFYAMSDKFSGFPAWSATAVISNDPMIGPPFCMRDKNKDGQPDEATHNFTTQDEYPFVIFPYKNMTTDQITSIYWDFENIDKDLMNMVMSWKYGEKGWFWSRDAAANLSTLTPQGLKIKLSLNGESIQEIECPLISSDTQNTTMSTPTPVIKKEPTQTATPRATSTPVTYPPEGFHDGNKGGMDANQCSAFGWAVDPDNRVRDLKVQVLSDGVPVATSTANLPRTDVKACTGGSCGFSINLWGVITTGEQHQITVQAYDEETKAWFNLSNTTKLLTCWGYPEGSHDGNNGNVNQESCAVSGWAVDPDDRNIDVTVRVLSDGKEVAQTIANIYRSDLNKPNLCANGTCGFQINLWNLVSHNVQHKILAQAFDEQSNMWRNLPGTPKTLNCGD